jgi:dipeptidyl aminopeptidase/acylaminoacyl peptidase
VDNNVLFQDAVQLTEKLIHEGKQFEESFYPEESHGYIRDESLQDSFGRTAIFFDRYLKEDQNKTADR